MGETLGELTVKYTPETDTLVVSGVGEVLGSYGYSVTHDLVAFTSEDGQDVYGFVLEHAAELLSPYLSQRPVTVPQRNSEF